MRKIWARCSDQAVQQWPLLLVAATAGAALLNPGIGAKGGALQYETVVPSLIVGIFFVIGLTVPLAQLREGTMAFDFHTMCQLYSLFVLPFTYYWLVYRWEWEVDSGILTKPFATGVMATMCMPTTGFTCVMFARQAGGDESVAVCNAAIGNILGPIIAPLTAHLVIHAKGAEGEEISGKAVALLCQLCLPLFIGALLQMHIMANYPDDLFFFQRQAKHIFNVVLTIVLYYIFCQGFASGAHDMTVLRVVSMVLWVLVVHIVSLAGAFAFGSAMPLRRRISLMFVGSQKTEGMAVAILTIITPHSGVLTLPVVAYHSVQMAVAAAICPYIRHWAAAQEGYEHIETEFEETEADLFDFDPLERSTDSEHGVDGVALIRRMRESCRSAESFTM